MENNKSPGNDWLKKEFCILLVKIRLVLSIERAYLVNQLSTLRKQLVIELTEKKGLNLFLYLTQI